MLFGSISTAQTTDIEIDEIRVNGSLLPGGGQFEFCQGEVPAFSIYFRLEAGSSTLTLTSTATLNISANVSGGNVINKTVTDVTTLFGGDTEIGQTEQVQYNWPVSGSKTIDLINAGLSMLFSP